jgi:single-stranded DNA-binding protein
MNDVTNSVRIAGNVVKDPKFINDEKNNFKVLNFTIVTVRQYIRDGRFANDKSFHKITLRGKIAEEYKNSIKKSMGVDVVGYLRNRNVVKGENRYPITEVAVDETYGNICLL